ncbi:MAG TPA: CPBP family intramembrane glutamic endopeptidase [Opitutaceae bacterium]|nr:CPBP family intramembrane glutamic endopeptidase [Opitutaceae bacterium]
MQNNPLAILVMIGVSAYVIRLWFADRKSAGSGTPNRKALPGITSAPLLAHVIGAVGALLIVLAETKGEIWLGVSGEQSTMTWLFAAYTLLAAFVEEIIFRGFLVVTRRGAAVRWASAVLASILFAALHPFLWDWKEDTLVWHFDTKGWFSFGAVFVTSLWFYVVRFARFNPAWSLAPCFTAHVTKNAAVVAIKLLQGHLVGLY